MKEIFSSLGIDQSFELVNEAHFQSCFSVSKLAASAVGAVGCALSELIETVSLSPSFPSVTVDQTLASLWFSQSIQPIGWEMPPVWDSIAGDYPTKNAWIKLHTNLAHHRNSALSVLKCEPNRAIVAEQVLNWNGDDLEAEIIRAGGVAAALRTREEWVTHAQGIAVASEPLVSWQDMRKGEFRQWSATLERPLNGIRVLDLTRVLAGPVSTRTLAGFGAEVLRIDPPGWEEANVVPDITLGKRCANLDLSKPSDRKVFENLIINADVLVHGYRPDALDRLGYGEVVRRQLSPNLIEVSLDAYGWTGPWSNRRGFDSLVQMSCGIANAGMVWANQKQPRPLPVQALDHATGYIMAAAVLRAIKLAINGNGIYSARLSLARTAELLISYPQSFKTELSIKPLQEHFLTREEITPWGNANRLRSALDVNGVPMTWHLAANELGSAVAKWN